MTSIIAAITGIAHSHPEHQNNHSPRSTSSPGYEPSRNGTDSASQHPAYHQRERSSAPERHRSR
jgi:hypothetical protein